MSLCLLSKAVASSPSYVTNTHSVVLNGTDEYISFGNILNKADSDAFSVSIWYEPSATSTGGSTDAIFAKQDATSAEQGYAFIRVNDTLYIVLSNNNGAGERILLSLASALTANTRDHWVLTYSGNGAASGVKLYKNAVSQSLTTVVDNLSGTMSNSAPLLVGARRVTPTDFAEGKVDAFSVYGKELSGAEVTELNNSGVAVDPDSLTFSADVELNAMLGESQDDLESAGGIIDTKGNNGSGGNLTNASNKSTDIT